MYLQRKVHQSTQLLWYFDLDTDSNGRWSVEKFKGLMFQIERDANVGKKHEEEKVTIITSSDVTSALQMACIRLRINLNNNLQVDDTGNTFGVLNGRYRVYIDPYEKNGQNSIML